MLIFMTGTILLFLCITSIYIMEHPSRPFYRFYDSEMHNHIIVFHLQDVEDTILIAIEGWDVAIQVTTWRNVVTST